MQLIHQTPMAAPGPIVAFTILWDAADPMAAYAEVKVAEQKNGRK